MKDDKQFTEKKSYPLSKLFPEGGRILLTGKGKDFVERLGLEATRHAILCVLCGENIRSQTEPLSRRRLAQVSGAIIAMFTQGCLTVKDFQENLSTYAVDQIENLKGKANLWPAQWVIGLNDKLMQNILRSDSKQLKAYVKEFDKAIKEAAKHCEEHYGNYNMALGYMKDETGQQVTLDWEGIARITTAIGAQTLAIRGSDKSMYGKLFERLILGSILTVLGYKRVEPTKNKLTHGVFWLSDSSANRECDATLLVAPGQLVRFDMGFIGKGNPEITKDKMSRFGNIKEAVEEGEQAYNSVTFIVIDTLKETVKTVEAKKKADAEIIQMSMQFWPYQIAEKLDARFGIKHEILKIPPDNLKAYMKERLDEVDVSEFLNEVTLEEITNLDADIEPEDENILHDDGEE